MQSLNLNNYIKPLVGLITLYYLFVAYTNSGFVQADEHYQIIEFANYKLGHTPYKGLAWEYEARLRPGIQPLLCFILFKTLGYIGITDGYFLAFALRASSALFAVFAIKTFVKSYENKMDWKRLISLMIFSYLLWFLPYINVRFSSETWSGLFFLLTATCLNKLQANRNTRQYILVGLFSGFAIIFRYQSTLFVLGIFLWLFIVHKIKIKHSILLALAIIGVVLLGVIIDFWLYGEFVFTVFNYFYVNLIEGKASSFGTAPWYQYIDFVYKSPGLFGFPIILSFVLLWIYDHRNPILWGISAFILVHSLIPHKELRFLFPLANFCPIVLFLAYQKLLLKLKFIKIPLSYKRWLIGTFLLLLIGINALGLIAITGTGVGAKRVSVSEFINRNYDEQRTNIILNDVQIYYDSSDLKNSFYNSDRLTTDHIASIWQDDFKTHIKKNYKNVLIIRNSDITGPQTINLLSSVGFHKVYETIPDFISNIYAFYNPSLNNFRLSIYELKNQSSK